MYLQSTLPSHNIRFQQIEHPAVPAPKYQDRFIDGDISSKLALVHIQICVIIAQQNKAKEPIAVVKKAPSAKYFNVTSYFKALLVTDLVGAFALHL